MLAEILYEHSLPTWLIVITIIFGVAAAGFWFWRYLPISGTSIVLALVRLLFIAALLWCLLRPLLKKTSTTVLKPRFLVVVDTSESMKQSPDDKTPSRWSVAQKILGQSWTRAVSSKAELDAYPFAEDVAAQTQVAAVEKLSPDGKSTNLRDSLRKVVDRYRGQGVAGLLLLTDGVDTREEDNSWATASWPCPIYTVRLEPKSIREVEPDVRVNKLDGPRRIVAGWESKLTAVVSGQGTKGNAINVQLLENGNLVQELPTQIPNEGGTREVVFHLEHPTVGNFIFTVNIPPLPGEVVTNDNSYAMSVQVIDTKNRLLYVEGSPRWESKYLTRVLKANKDITPLAFLRGPNKTFLTIGQRGTMTLDMTAEQLLQYKIVILGDLSAEELTEPRAAALLKFVEDGGSLVLLGGPSAWGDKGFGTTSLAKLMPVKRTGFLPPQEGKFTVALTDEGRTHPAFAANEDSWKIAPPVLSFFPGTALSAGASALVATQTAQGSQPIVVAQRYGQGKVTAILTDSLWRWQLDPGQSEAYQRFWNQMVQWLTPSEGEKETIDVDLFADTDQQYLGDKINLGARLGGREGLLPKDIAVTCEIKTPEGRKIPFPMAKQTVTTGTGKKFPGYGLEYVGQGPGLHTAVAVAEIGGKKIESAPYSFYIKPFTPETSPKPANSEVLVALAESSSGKFCEADEVDKILSSLELKGGEEERVTYKSLWNNIPMLACLMAMLTVDWIIRKVKNMA